MKPFGLLVEMLLMVWSLGQLAPLIHQLKPPLCCLPLFRLNWMWLIDLLRLLTLSSQLHRPGSVERKWETQRRILQTDFNGFVGYINDIDCERSGPNEAKPLSRDVTCDCRGRAEPEWNWSTDKKNRVPTLGKCCFCHRPKCSGTVFHKALFWEILMWQPSVVTIKNFSINAGKFCSK